MTDGEPPHEPAASREGYRTLQERVSRPDYMLLGIAGVFAVGIGLAGVVPAMQNLAIGVSSVFALVLIGDLLFRNPPRAMASEDARDEGGRPGYLRNVKYDSGCVELWDHLSEIRYDT
ncbi:hypothetical protein [Salarchaeum sp. JOR-1]|uniref:hypothetical protein n=1 Tax=Salarchaeum sp. JOR-1 TaxID=2599399 RepID=UPI0011982AD7|nr:hypothetical protein [Salarchaeum sp. JOR-1]QDX41787.1 hypothetical protein FQU85_13055 [Salarchaeum sp. JOR-1]